jgi:hypothetical protein
MDTTTNQNLGDSNSIPSLSFIWKVQFSDGTILNQFDELGEHRFQEVKDRFNELSYFYLIHKNLPIGFIIDFKNGLIFFNNQKIEPKLITKKVNIRPIFFNETSPLMRRHFVKIGMKDLKEKQHEIFYFLGIQWNDEKNNNHKIILQIDENGNFIVTGE